MAAKKKARVSMNISLRLFVFEVDNIHYFSPRKHTLSHTRTHKNTRTQAQYCNMQ